jgi:hypothetical protein
MPRPDARRCCFVGCGKDAEYELWAVRSQGIAGPDPYSDNTDACEEHVGPLLSYQPDAERPEEIYWEVRWIGKVNAHATA